MIEEILNYFPRDMAYILQSNINLCWKELEEIRIRVLKPIILKFNFEEKIINYNVTQKEVLEIIQRICDNSVYSYQEQICNRIYNNKRRA